MSDNKKKQSTMSFLVGAVGRAVISGLAFYGAKKLYEDYWKGESQESQHVEAVETSKPDPLDSDSDSEMEDDDGLALTSNQALSKPQNLLASLQDYLDHYIKPDVLELETAKRVITELEEYIVEILDQACPELPIGKLVHTGSAYEGLQVIKADDFDAFVQLHVDPSQWELIDGKDTLLDAPGYSLVKRSNQEFFKVGTVPWDKYLVGHYLSPQKLIQYFQSVLQRCIQPGKKVFTIEPSVKENSLSVTVIYGSDQKLRLNLVPLVKIGAVSVAGRLHPKYENFGMDGYKNLWRQSFMLEEEALMGTLDGCQKDCLMILKGISMNNYRTPLHHVEPYIFKTVLFHLSQVEENWDKEVLAERLIDMFMALDGYLETGKLPNYFNSDTNLFEGYTDIFLRSLKQYVCHVMGKNKFCALLSQRCPGKDI